MNGYLPFIASDWFWSIIEHANKNRQELTTILEGLSKEEIQRFADEFERAAYELWDNDILYHLSDLERVSEDGLL